MLLLAIIPLNACLCLNPFWWIPDVGDSDWECSYWYKNNAYAEDDEGYSDFDTVIGCDFDLECEADTFVVECDVDGDCECRENGEVVGSFERNNVCSDEVSAAFVGQLAHDVCDFSRDVDVD